MRLTINYVDGSSPFTINALIHTIHQHIALQVETSPKAIKSI